MTTLPLPLDDARIVWVPVAIASARGWPLVGYTGLEDEHPGEVAVRAESVRAPRACAAGIELSGGGTLPSGAVERAQAALGKRGNWPVPRPGWFGEEE